MPFAYYKRLNQDARRVYRQSDEIASLRLPASGTLAPLVAELEQALAGEDRAAVQLSAQLLLATSFHTEGFYKRESGLVRQLLPNTPRENGSAHAG